MRKLILFFSLFVLFIVSAGEAKAQGANSVWCDSFCNTTLINCEPGFIVPFECRSLPQDCCYTLFGDGACPAFISCVPEPGPTPTPTPRPPCFPPNNLCFRYQCPEGYNITSDVCSYYEDVCCRLVSLGTPTPAPTTVPQTCYECFELVPSCIPHDQGDPRCEFSSSTTCDSICLGSAGRHSCDGLYCVADNNGPFASLEDCTASCGGGSNIPSLTPTIITCPGTGSLGFDTAIGCIPLEDLNEFSKFTLGWGIGIAGGIAFLLILYAGFMIMTSTGDPRRLQAGRELLTAAIAGLLLLIFAVYVLRLVGVEILGLPEFGG